MSQGIALPTISAKSNPLDVGAIAITLAEAYDAGFPVQNGIVLPSKLFKEFALRTGIQRKLLSLLARKDYQGMHDLVLTKEDPLIGSAILNAVHDAGISRPFVRASSVFSDHSFVRLSDMDSLFDDVRACWASLFVGANNGSLNSKTLFSAVLIQQQVDVKKRGVLYTHNPLGKDRCIVDVHQPKEHLYLVEKRNHIPLFVKEYPGIESPLTIQEREQITKLAKNLDAHYGKEIKANWVLSNRAYITSLREMDERDSTHLASHAASSSLRSNS